MTSRLHLGPAFVACLSAAILVAAIPAHAKPPRHQQFSHAPPTQVIQRLTLFGELSPVQARALQKAVSKRMKRAVFHDSRDAVRAVVARAVVPRDARIGNSKKHAKPRPNPALVRSRLRAGLDLWALEHVFVPGTAAMQVCDRGFALSTNLCEALLAAGGGVSLAGAHVLGGRKSEPEVDAPAAEERTFASIAPHTTPAPAAPAPAAVRASDVTAPRPAERAPVQSPQPQLESKAQSKLDSESQSKSESSKYIAVAKAQPRVEPAPAPPPPPSAAELADIARRKAEYQRQRDAYLDRQRAELEARKARIAATGASERVQRGPASEMEARVAGLSPDSVVKQRAQAAPAKNASGNSNTGLHQRPGAATPANAGSEDEVDSLVGDLLSK